jgi:hypothetical protein
MSSTTPHTFKERTQESLTRFLTVFIYTWILLAIFAIHKSIVLSEYNFTYRQGLQVLNALVLAKILFIGEELRFGERFKDQPLIYAMLFKAFVFAILLVTCDLLEGLIVGYFRGESVAKSISDVGGGTIYGVIMTGIVMFVVLIPFFGFRELSEVIGERRLHDLLFVRRTKFAESTECDRSP